MMHEDLSPKPVYQALKSLIHEEWNTRAEGKTDAAGNVSFRGFYGAYRVQAGPPGAVREVEFHLEKGAQNVLAIRME